MRLSPPSLAFLSLIGIALLAPATANSEVPEDDTLPFKVTRNGTELGTHIVRFSRDGEKTVVDIAIDFHAGFGPFTFYRYEHENREVWNGDKLLSMDSETNDNGSEYAVEAERRGDVLRIEAQNGTSFVPADVTPTSYWNYDKTVNAKRLLNTQRGTLMDVTVEAAGTEMHPVNGVTKELECYMFKSRLLAKLCYEPDTKLWAHMSFETRGQEIVYTRNEAVLTN